MLCGGYTNGVPKGAKSRWVPIPFCRNSQQSQIRQHFLRVGGLLLKHHEAGTVRILVSANIEQLMSCFVGVEHDPFGAECLEIQHIGVCLKQRMSASRLIEGVGITSTYCTSLTTPHICGRTLPREHGENDQVKGRQAGSAGEGVYHLSPPENKLRCSAW